ncbi:hypothetical protein [Streptomyces sp. NPDC054842]
MPHHHGYKTDLAKLRERTGIKRSTAVAVLAIEDPAVRRDIIEALAHVERLMTVADARTFLDRAQRPGVAALRMIRTAALDAAVRHAAGSPGLPPVNRAAVHELRDLLTYWSRTGTFYTHACLLTYWLAVELCTYQDQLLGGREALAAWLTAFGEQVEHYEISAGSVALDMMFAVAADLPREERLTEIAASFRGHLRPGHVVHDAVGLALTLQVWAGAQLAALMQDETDRIAAYIAAREPSARQPA